MSVYEFVRLVEVLLGHVSAFLLLDSSMSSSSSSSSTTVIQGCPEHTHTDTHWRLCAVDPASCCPAAGRSVGERCGFGTFCSVRVRVRDQSVSLLLGSGSGSGSVGESLHVRLHPLFLWVSSGSAIIGYSSCCSVWAVLSHRSCCISSTNALYVEAYNFCNFK